MIETYPLEKAAEAYARMMSGKAEFRVVLTMERNASMNTRLFIARYRSTGSPSFTRGRPERRANASPAARTSLFVADVRAALRPAFRSLSPGRARLPGLRTQRLAGPEKFAYTFDHYAEIMNHFTEALGLSRYTLYMQDYGGPVGFRMALAHPERIEALIVQDAVAHNEGLGANWKTRRAFWADRAANESALRVNLLSLATTRTRHVGKRSQRGTL
jgi:hypothetical protein